MNHFISISHLDIIAVSVHEKKLLCNKCNKSFNRPYRLVQHNIKYHSVSPAYQCDHQGCFGNFMTWSALQLHIKTEHPKDKVFYMWERLRR